MGSNSANYDLVQRLRSRMDADELELEAADEIERLTREDECKAREIERLRAEVARVDAEARQHMLQAMSNGQTALIERSRAETAERELAALRERFEKAPVRETYVEPRVFGRELVFLLDEALPDEYKDHRVRLVRED